MNNIRETNVFLTQVRHRLPDTRVCVCVLSRRNLHAIIRRLPHFSPRVSVSWISVQSCLYQEIPLTALFLSIFLHMSLSLSPHSCLRTRSDQGRFPSTHAGKTVSARRAIFHLLYLSVRNTVVVTDAENLAEAFIAKKKRFIRCLANERIRDAWYSCNNIER